MFVFSASAWKARWIQYGSRRRHDTQSTCWVRWLQGGHIHTFRHLVFLYDILYVSTCE